MSDMATLYLNLLFLFFILVYIYWIYGLLRALKSDAPFVPIKNDVMQAMIALVEPKPGDVWIDLGSGDARVLIAACREYNIRGVGFERVRPIRVYSRMRILFAGLKDRITIKSGDFFKADVSQADIVSFYLSHEAHAKVYAKLKKEGKRGVQLIYHRFPIEGVDTMTDADPSRVYRTVIT